MRLLSRYLFRECLAAFGYCMSGFLIFWIVVDLSMQLRTMQDNRLNFGEVLMYYLFKLPDFLPLAVPMALLLAMLYALSNHARHNEITAIRAAGVSLARIALPYFVIAFGAASVMFCANEFCAPITSERADDILFQRAKHRRSPEERHEVTNLTFHNARENRHWRIGIYNLRTGAMTDAQVTWRLPTGTWRSLSADHAARTNGVWTFYEVREFRQVTPSNSQVMRLPQTNVMAVAEFTETIDEIRSEVKVSSRFDHPTRTYRADIPLVEIVNYLKLHPSPPRDIRPKLYTKLHGRFAGPLTCVVVVLLAVPFGAASGRRNVFVGVAASIFIFFTFYILQQFGLAFGEAGHVPPWVGAWLPNLAFGIAGLWMMIKVR